MFSFLWIQIACVHRWECLCASLRVDRHSQDFVCLDFVHLLESLGEVFVAATMTEAGKPFNFPICLDLAYKPVVQGCGHIFWFWSCTHPWTRRRCRTVMCAKILYPPPADHPAAAPTHVAHLPILSILSDVRSLPNCQKQTCVSMHRNHAPRQHAHESCKAKNNSSSKSNGTHLQKYSLNRVLACQKSSVPIAASSTMCQEQHHQGSLSEFWFSD
jgi:hypothetical protein